MSDILRLIEELGQPVVPIEFQVRVYGQEVYHYALTPNTQTNTCAFKARIRVEEPEEPKEYTRPLSRTVEGELDVDLKKPLFDLIAGLLEHAKTL